MALIFVDTEAFGGAPCVGKLTEFGAVEFKSQESFHGVLWKASPDAINPALSRLDEGAVQKSDPERVKVFIDFEKWLYKFDGRPVFFSDNPAYDFQWINDGFWKYLGRNPFGHSGRRISDFYSGLVGNLYETQGWKSLRVTIHDHNPVHDALGNVEAMKRLLAGERPKQRGTKLARR